MPHPIPYQGSKRKQAPIIAGHFPKGVATLYEPFCGSAAMSLYAAERGLAEHFILGDALGPIVDLLETIIEEPGTAADGYRRIWAGQDGSPEYFNEVRRRFNADRDPLDFLFLAARCVANAIRFNGKGHFAQSQDNRRKGTHPDRMEREIFGASRLLKGRVGFFRGDFSQCIAPATSRDLVYMDPPYQGTTEGPDRRYFSGLERARLESVLADLNRRGVPFLVSYDGAHGEKTYGAELPAHLEVGRLLIETGRSTQGTLSGREVLTREGLYMSRQGMGGVGAP